MKEEEEFSGKDRVVFDEESFYDQSDRAEMVLDSVLNDSLEDEIAAINTDPARRKVRVSEALHAQPVIKVDSHRIKSRVLFITSDESALEKDSPTQKKYRELSALFSEVHVMVLFPHEGKEAPLREGDNIWFYKVYAKYWWRLPRVAQWASDDHLSFNGSVRPDVIVGTDPYEAGLSAYYVARNFKRPVQIHVPEDFLEPTFVERDTHNKWRKRIANYVLHRVLSVRTNTDRLKEKLTKKYKKIVDVDTLPKFYNFAGLREAKPASDIHDTYKDFVFIMLAFGPLTADSHLHDTFTVLHGTLLNKKIGLIVVGKGPAKKLFEEKVEILGIKESVVFIPRLSDLVSYMKTADALVQTDISEDSEQYVLKAAAAGLSIVTYETELRKDLFKDGTSAFLCPAGDVQCLAKKVAKFMNTAALRVQFARNSQSMAEQRLKEDPQAYYTAFRDTIEVILVPPEEEEEEEEKEETEEEIKESIEVSEAPEVFNESGEKMKQPVESPEVEQDEIVTTHTNS